MARSRFMATGVEAGSAIAALQGEVGFERAADLLKALRGASHRHEEHSTRPSSQNCACL